MDLKWHCHNIILQILYGASQREVRLCDVVYSILDLSFAEKNEAMTLRWVSQC